MLFDLIVDVVDWFVVNYIGFDGELFWLLDDYVGVDGFDDVVEGFYNWLFVYVMGGDECLFDYVCCVYEFVLECGVVMEMLFGYLMVVDEFE